MADDTEHHRDSDIYGEGTRPRGVANRDHTSEWNFPPFNAI